MLSFCILYLRRPICVAFRNVTTRRRTVRPLGRKQGTLPWDIPPTISVYNWLFGYPIDGWPTSRSMFAARWLFCPLSEWVRIDPIIICPPRPVVLCVTQTRVRFASPVSSTPSDLSGLPLREVCILIVLSFSLCWKKIGILWILSRSCPSAVYLLFPWSTWIQSWSRAPNCSEYPLRRIVRNNSGLQLNHLFNNRGSCLSHTTDTAQEGIVPQRMHLSHTVYIHIIKRKSVQYEQLIYSGTTTYRSISLSLTLIT